MFSTPKYLAVFFATVNSLYSSTSNPTENVFILGLIFAAKAVTIVESMPPERKLPTSTLAII